MDSERKITIDRNELLNRLSDPTLKILFVKMAGILKSESPTPSEDRLIPGSIVFDVDDFSDPSSGLPHTMLSLPDFQGRLRRLGLHSSDEIIVYDDQGVYSSPRARFMLLSAGHQQVRVLDGGLPAWIHSNFPTEKSRREIQQEGDFEIRLGISTFVDQSFVLDGIKSNSIQVIDARSSERFHGTVQEPRKGLRLGHIPKAVSLPFTECIENGFLKQIDELRELFRNQIRDQNPVVFYCGSGVTACISALAAEIAGVKQIRVYDGSWSEWGRDPLLPIES